MKALLGIYLSALGAGELLLAFWGDVSPVLHPFGGILWSTFFVESRTAFVAFSLATALAMLAVGLSLFLRPRRWPLVAFAIVFGLLAIWDAYLPVVVIFTGGSHALPAGGAGLMLLEWFLTQALPVILCAGLAGSKRLTSQL